ncbi:NHL repeat-containing protein [Actinoplanes sp. N902-109]|nr:NHL repeat-containing protein [Actinoplanes sp. N902-109]
MESAAAASPPPFLLELVAGTGAASATVPGPALSSPVGMPSDVAVDSQGNRYVVSYASGNCYVLKVSPDGTISKFAGNGNCGSDIPGPATASPLSRPISAAVDSHDNVYVVQDLTGRVVRITPDGVLSDFAGNGSSSGAVVEGPALQTPLRPVGITVDRKNNVYLGVNSTGVDGGYIVRIDTFGMLSILAGNGSTAVTPGPARSSGLQRVYGMAFDSMGDL